MRAITTVLLAVFALSHAFSYAGDAVGQEIDVRIEERSAEWRASPPGAVSIKDGVVKLVAHEQSVAFSRRLDPTVVAGKSYLFSVEARGEGIQVGEMFFDCGKLQVVYTAEGAARPTYEAALLKGTFDWRRVERMVRFPANVRAVELRLVLEDTTGVLWFRNPVVRLAVPDDSFPYEIPNELAVAPYRVSIDTTSERPLNQFLYGFNTNLTNSPVSYGSDVVRELVGELSPGILRFPGGTIGNWYDWRIDAFDGVPATAPGFARATLRLKREGRTYGFDGFVELTQISDIEPIIMVNILTQSAEDAVEWFAEMESEGLLVFYCELGNETYSPGQSNDATSTVEGYIAVTKRFAEALRAAYPELRIAVAAAPLGERIASDKFKAWNEALAREDYYDAVVHHEYGGPGNDIFRARTVEALLGAEEAVDRTVQEFRKVFGQRPMWITEWNIGIRSMGTFGHTGLAGLHYAARYLRMLDHPDVIEVALLHQLYGRQFGPFAVSPDGSVTRWGDFPVWQLIAGATRNSHAILDTEISPCKHPTWAFQMSNARAFLGMDGIRVLLVNKLPIAKQVHLFVDGRAWTEGGTLATFGASRLGDKPRFGMDEPIIETRSFREVCHVPPYSVSVLTIG